MSDSSSLLEIWHFENSLQGEVGNPTVVRWGTSSCSGNPGTLCLTALRLHFLTSLHCWMLALMLLISQASRKKFDKGPTDTQDVKNMYLTNARAWTGSLLEKKKMFLSLPPPLLALFLYRLVLINFKARAITGYSQLHPVLTSCRPCPPLQFSLSTCRDSAGHSPTTLAGLL